MPNIPEYQQQQLGLQPTELGIQALTQSAYRGRALYDEAAASIGKAGGEIGGGIAAAGAAAVQHEAHQEVQAGAARSIQMFDALSQSKDAAIKAIDPNDPDYSGKVEAAVKQWREEQLEPTLEKFQGGFNTEQSQQWAQRNIDTMRQHLFIQSAADIRNAASIGVTNSVNTIITSSSNAALRNPASGDALMAMAEHSIQGLVGSSAVRGTDAAKLQDELIRKAKTEIAHSIAFGAITQSGDPEAAVKAVIAKYPDYINGPEAETLARAAVNQRKVNEYYTRAAINQQKQAASFGAEKAINDAFDKNVTVDPDGTTHIGPDFFKTVSKIPGQFQDAPGAAEKAKTYINWGQAQLKQQETGKKIADDPYVVHGLRDLIRESDKPASELEMAVRQGEGNEKVSTKTGNLLIQQIKSQNQISDPMFKQVVKIADGQIAPKAVDPDQQNRATAFQIAFTNEYLRQQRAGTLQPNALDMNDPDSLVSKMMGSYMQPIAGAVQANGGVGAPAPAKSAAPVTISNRAEYDKLAPGTGFIGPDGKPYVKPMKAAQ